MADRCKKKCDSLCGGKMLSLMSEMHHLDRFDHALTAEAESESAFPRANPDWTKMLPSEHSFLETESESAFSLENILAMQDQVLDFTLCFPVVPSEVPLWYSNRFPNFVLTFNIVQSYSEVDAVIFESMAHAHMVSQMSEEELESHGLWLPDHEAAERVLADQHHFTELQAMAASNQTHNIEVDNLFHLATSISMLCWDCVLFDAIIFSVLHQVAISFMFFPVPI